MKKFLALALVLVLTFVLAACGGSASSSTAASSEAAPAETASSAAAEAPSSDPEGTGAMDSLKVAMLLPGPINDGGWNTMAYTALQELETQLGAEIAYTENVTQNDQVQLLRQYATQGYNIMIGHGYEFKDALLQVGEEFPDAVFLNFGSSDTENGKNVGSISYAYGETGALMGVLAGMMPDVTKVGAVHAFENPTGEAESKNVEHFARKYNPDIEWSYSYTQNWDDINLAKEACIALLNNGCQIIVSDMSGPADAMIQACKEAGAMYIEITFDASELGPDTVICSGVHDATRATVEAVKDVQAGHFSGGVYSFGLESGVMSVGTYGPMVTDEMKAEVEAVKAEIIAGTADLMTMDEAVAA